MGGIHPILLKSKKKKKGWRVKNAAKKKASPSWSVAKKKKPPVKKRTSARLAATYNSQSATQSQGSFGDTPPPVLAPKTTRTSQDGMGKGVLKRGVPLETLKAKVSTKAKVATKKAKAAKKTKAKSKKGKGVA